MAGPFSRTFRSLKLDAPHRSFWALAVGGGLLAAWTIWFGLARLPLYEVTQSARLEVAHQAHSLDAPAAGRIDMSALAIGKPVQAGEVLITLEARVERLRLEEEQARHASLITQQERLKEQIAAQERLTASLERAAEASVAEARARQREVEAGARFATEEARRVGMLHASDSAPEMEALRLGTEAEQHRARADAQRLGVDRLAFDRLSERRQADARLAALRREQKVLEGQMRISQIAVQTLRAELDRRQLRAPVSGRIAEAATLRHGTYVREGERLGTIVPDGQLAVVAEFPPASALGRIRPGQPARLQLDGFPWSQYGSVPAVVSHVASEVRNGSVRVELALAGPMPLTVAMQHGLPGSLEVQVEELTPALLVLRTAGQWLGRPAGETRLSQVTP